MIAPSPAAAHDWVQVGSTARFRSLDVLWAAVLSPCRRSDGEVPERSIGAVSKTVVPLAGDRGFESLPLRQPTINYWTSNENLAGLLVMIVCRLGGGKALRNIITALIAILVFPAIICNWSQDILGQIFLGILGCFIFTVVTVGIVNRLKSFDGPTSKRQEPRSTMPPPEQRKPHSVYQAPATSATPWILQQPSQKVRYGRRGAIARRSIL